MIARARRRHAGALACIAGSVLLIHGQLVLHIGTHFIGRPIEDAVAVIWQFWWAGEALFGGQSLLYAPGVYYPHGYYLASDAQSLWLMIPWAALARLVGPLAAYNVALLSTLAVGGAGTYLLGEHLTGKRLAGVLAGAVYISAPVMTLRLGGHLNILLAAQFLPYLALSAARATSSPGRGAWGYSIGAGLAFGLATLGSWYVAFIGFLVALCFFAFGSGPASAAGRALRLGACLLVWALLTAPLALLAMQANAAMFGGTVGFALADSDIWSMGVDRLFLPNSLAAITRGLAARHWPVRSEADFVSLGYTSVLLAILGVWKARARPGLAASLALFLLAVILSMGTTLHWGQQRVLLDLPPRLAGLYARATGWLTGAVTSDPAIPLPGLVLARFVPLYAMMRVWARYMLAGMLGLAVLAGHGAAHILGAKRGTYLAVLATALILLEGAILPYKDFTPLETVQRPVDAWLAEQPAGTALAEYPWPHKNKNALLSQTVHGQPVVNGYAPHVPLFHRQAPEVLRTWPNEATVALLREWGVRYLLVTEYDSSDMDEVWADLAAIPGLRKVRAFPAAGGAMGVAVHVLDLSGD